MQRLRRLLQRNNKQAGQSLRDEIKDDFETASLASLDGSAHSKLSRASTRAASSDKQDVVTLHSRRTGASDPASFQLAQSAPEDVCEDSWRLPVLLDPLSGKAKLSLASVCDKPGCEQGVMFLGVSSKLQYRPFCADFGPFNLGI